MDDQWIYPSGSQASAADQLDALQRAQDALWVKLRREDDPERRMGLLSEFRENRDAIERLTRSVAAGTGIDDGPSADSSAAQITAIDSTAAHVNQAAGGEPGDNGTGADADRDRERGDDVGDDEIARGEEADEPVWGVHEDDDPAEGIKPLSFNDTGELVAHDLTGVSSPTPLAKTDDAEPLSDEVDTEVATRHEVDDAFGGDSERSYQPVPSIFGGAELAQSNGNGGSNGGSNGNTANDNGSADGNGSEHSDASYGAGFDEGLGERRSENGDENPERLSEHVGSDEVATTAAAEEMDSENRRSMDRYGEAAEEDLSAYFLAEGSQSDIGAYGDADEPTSPPDYQQPLPGFGHSGAVAYPSPADSDPAALRAQASSRTPAPTSQYPAIRPPREPARQRGTAESEAESPRRALMLLAGLVAVLGVSWVLLSGPGGDAPTSAASEPTGSTSVDEQVAAPSADAEVDEIMVGLSNMGLNTVGAERRGSVIFLTGIVPTVADRDIAIRVAQGVASEQPINASELTAGPSTSQTSAPASDDGRAATFQTELNRIVAATPLIFQVEETSITDLHARILNSVASVIKSYPDIQLTIVGYTDNTGSDENNRAISLSRAESVKAYLVSQGLPEGNFALDARGEDVATGAQALANLERRVEFEVNQPEGVAAADSAAPLRIAIVAPSARNDLAFTQSMVDAANVIAADRGSVDVAITDSTFVPEEAAAAIRGYAAEGYDLVIAHGSQFGPALVEIAQEFPDVTFAWGTASDTFGLPNVYAYDAASQEGGFVMGAMSTLLSESGVVGVVGPIEVGDARLYVEGFQAGARSSKPDATVLVDYTGSFSDLTLAAETAQAQIAGGADVMTGSAQMVVGAVSVASENGTYWFGTQSNQTSLAPSLVVASQVYHWEVILRQIIADIDGGSPSGKTYTANLANGGLVIEYNPDVVLPESIRARADQVTAAIIDGSLQVPIG